MTPHAESWFASGGNILTCKRFIISFIWWGFAALLPVRVSLHAQTVDLNPLHLSPDHATVSVADLDKECHWYQNVLGFHESKRLRRSPERELCYLTIPGYRLDLLSQKGSIRHQVTTGALEQGWMNVVFKSSDIDGAYKHLAAQGIDVKVDRREDGTIEHLTFFDPEGNEIGIAPE